MAPKSLVRRSFLLSLVSGALPAESASSGSLQDCLQNAQATVFYPQSTGYNDTAKSQNTNYDYQPAAILQPNSTEETAAIVKCVVAENGATKLSSFGGGHGYASYALGGTDGFVVIDASKLQDVELNEGAGTVTVGAGQKLGPVAISIGAKGYGLPHGTCPSVGVVGHSLGGGWGFSSRRWGWLLDRIVFLTIVDAKGNIRDISPSSKGADEDLWWAMRGAGANNFGVVTSSTFKVEQAPAQSVNFKTIFQTNEECAEALVGYQEMGLDLADVNGLSSKFGAQLLLYGEGGGDPGACHLIGQYLGPLNEFLVVKKKIVAKFEGRGIKIGQFINTEFPSWVETLTDLMGSLNAPPTKVPYYAKSVIDDGSPEYSKESALAITRAVQKVVGLHNTGTSISFDLNGPGSGTNAKQPNGDSAFAIAGHRKALFLSQVYVNGYPGFDQPQQQEAVNQAVDGIVDAVKAANPSDTWQAYVNYVDPRLEDWAQEYYGQALPRLKSIKKAEDPTTVFDYPQGLAHA
ncbi:hypothetical protein DOTSEDRAFT_136186 [Dothistroma septosporum NZE10]|uniref:FAD-binding PCMH-type domain-containing protein n=1 Tax=Dothistroma septosporum (strain NZE10 / CBS 128990) TaxID=675120 RepID=N1PFG0_DOTSN|nr:hypothetical protein DOTSEDRAFT_136186 [Dothistroma septosporum NZE10]